MLYIHRLNHLADLYHTKNVAVVTTQRYHTRHIVGPHVLCTFCGGWWDICLQFLFPFIGDDDKTSCTDNLWGCNNLRRCNNFYCSDYFTLVQSSVNKKNVTFDGVSSSSLRLKFWREGCPLTHHWLLFHFLNYFPNTIWCLFGLI